MNMREKNRQVIEQFRAGGPIEGMHRERLLLLTTIGARTGRRYTTPMMFHRDANRLLVIASNIGAPKHPDWYLNLLAEPKVTVELPDETYDAIAHPATGPEYDQLWTMITGRYPFFADHQNKTTRTIPVVIINRA